MLRFFHHALPGSEVGEEGQVLIECDWYRVVGTNPLTHLPQVTYDQGLSAMFRIVCLKVHNTRCLCH